MRAIARLVDPAHPRLETQQLRVGQVLRNWVLAQNPHVVLFLSQMESSGPVKPWSWGRGVDVTSALCEWTETCGQAQALWTRALCEWTETCGQAQALWTDLVDKCTL